MSKESFLSREVFLTQFPSVPRVSAKFQYNFFTPNESTVNAERSGSRVIEPRPVDTATADAIDRRALQKKVPRYVLIEFRGNRRGLYREFDNEARTGLVSQNRRNLNLESHITTSFFSSARFQDQTAREKIIKQILRLAQIADIDLEPTKETSQTDISEAVDAVTGDYISKDDLLELVHDEVFDKVRFVNEVESIPDKQYEDAQTFKTSMQIDTRFIADIYSANNCKMNRGTKGLRYLDHIRARQRNARSSSTSAINMDVDYEPSVRVINQVEEVDEHVLPKMASVGYVITKSKIVDGQKRRMETFYVDGVHITQFIDPKVAYGQTYVYEVSTVTLVEMTIDVDENEEEPSIRFLRFLVQSNPSRDAKVMCVESEAPPPPDAIFYKYDYDRDSLVIDWRHPITSQRDIKGFQVFRRKNVNEAFQLLQQYNFDDSMIKYPIGESPNYSIVKETNYPVMTYEDLDFDRSSKFIYTVCSIDAHGYLSNYGTQTEVKFDRNNNKIRLRNISQPGAPRQYPNMFISPTEAQNIDGVRLTEDVMRDSMHTKMRVYFDPEYHRVGNRKTGDLKHLATEDQGGVYKFEVLSLDRQKSKTLTIKLKNRRFSRYRRRRRMRR